jgi:predicted small lipoprotein YifL
MLTGIFLIKNKKLIMKKLFLILLLITFVSLSGCGKKDDKSQIGKDDKKSEEVKKDDGNQNSGEPKDNETIKLNDLGISEGMPKNYPGDIPQPKNSKCLGSLSSSEGTVVNFESTDKINELVVYFKEEMKKSGFNIIEGGDIIVSDDAAILGWKKNDRDVSVIMSFDKDKSKSQIAITYK